MKLSVILSLLNVGGVCAFATIKSTSTFLGKSTHRNNAFVAFSTEEDIEDEIEEELKKSKRMSNLRNANGVDYAPWMNISADDEEKIRQITKSKNAARLKRQEEEKKLSGALLMDSQAQELSGVGLSSKVIGEDIELEWATSAEGNTAGFIIKRRPAKTEDYQVIASYKDWGPLVSKGPDGGVYRYTDTTAGVGGWVYRITECEKNGIENDICQGLVDVQTSEERMGNTIAVGAIGVLFIGLIAAGTFLDPNGGF